MVDDQPTTDGGMVHPQDVYDDWHLLTTVGLSGNRLCPWKPERDRHGIENGDRVDVVVFMPDGEYFRETALLVDSKARITVPSHRRDEYEIGDVDAVDLLIREAE